MRRKLLLSLVAGMLLPSLGYACPKHAEFNKHYRANDLAALKQLHPRILNCNENTRIYFNFLIANKFYKDMSLKNMQGKARLSRLNEIYALNEDHWRTLYDLAEIKSEIVAIGQLKQSYRLYEKTLRVINNLGLTPDKEVPSRQFINSLQQKLSLVNSIITVKEEGFISQDSLRSGGYKTVTRGVQAVVTHLPIRFGYNKHQLAGNDLKNAQLIMKEYKINTPAKITIVGHTDRVGSQAFNQPLSVKRAITLKDYLLKNGVRSQINVIGKGKSQPLELSPSYRKQLSQEEIDLLNRRLDIHLSH